MRIQFYFFSLAVFFLGFEHFQPYSSDFCAVQDLNKYFTLIYSYVCIIIIILQTQNQPTLIAFSADSRFPYLAQPQFLFCRTYTSMRLPNRQNTSFRVAELGGWGEQTKKHLKLYCHTKNERFQTCSRSKLIINPFQCFITAKQLLLSCLQRFRVNNYFFQMPQDVSTIGTAERRLPCDHVLYSTRLQLLPNHLQLLLYSGILSSIGLQDLVTLHHQTFMRLYKEESVYNVNACG